MSLSAKQTISERAARRLPLDRKLATYLAATGAVGTILASEAEAVIVWEDFGGVPQPVGINGEVSIDWNSDGTTDWEIDHDRFNLNGTDLDFLQIDKNDVTDPNSGGDILDNPDNTFTYNFPPAPDVTPHEATETGYVTDAPGDALGYYPLALQKGEMIGPSRFFDFQEGTGFQPGGTYIRVNRLIDEDMGQIDADNGQSITNPLPDTPHWTGLGGEVRYLGLKMDLNAEGEPGDLSTHNYGWIGVRITSDEDATAEVTGWGYETVRGEKILAGQIPEASSILLAIVGGAALISCLLGRTLFGRKRL